MERDIMENNEVESMESNEILEFNVGDLVKFNNACRVGETYNEWGIVSGMDFNGFTKITRVETDYITTRGDIINVYRLEEVNGCGYTKEMLLKPTQEEIEEYERAPKCYVCGGVLGEVVGSDYEVFGEHNVCRHCIDRYLSTCSDCGEYCTNNSRVGDLLDLPRWIYVDNERVCNICIDTGDYVRCSNCGNVHHCGDTFYDEELDRDFCRYCYDHRHSGCILDYSDAHDVEHPAQTIENDRDTKILIGTEIEIDGGEYRGDTAYNFIKTIPCVCAEDGSLNDNGIEVITHPMSNDYLHAHIDDFKSAFEYAKNNYYDGNDSCGLHVHITRPYKRNKDKQNDVINRVLLFMETYKDELIKFARRHSTHWSKWLSDNYDEEGKKFDSIRKIEKIKGKYQEDKYTALNLKHEDTLEFRIFHGTLDIDTYVATCDLCYYLVKYAKEVENIETLTWEYLVNNSGEYVKNYVDRLDIHTDKPMKDMSLEEIRRENEFAEKRMLIIDGLRRMSNAFIKEYTKKINIYKRDLSRINSAILLAQRNNMDKLAYNINRISRTIETILTKDDYASINMYIKDMFDNIYDVNMVMSFKTELYNMLNDLECKGGE